MNSPSDTESKNDVLDEKKSGWLRRSFNPFRIATLRGLAVMLPPLLTVMLFAWAWNSIDRAILRPVESLTRHSVAWAIDDIRDAPTINAELAKLDPEELAARSREEKGQAVYKASDGIDLVQLNDQWIPLEVFTFVKASPGDRPLVSGHDYYERYVQLRYLKRHLVLPALLAILLGVMYLTGKLLAVGIGRIFWHWFESLINRVPIIRNVYSSVKQVTDFAFKENDIEFTRVVAVEYPRKGIWSIGFVTGESFEDIRKAVGEPMLSVLMPTSPMPATGFTITTLKSETIDLDITIDQAIQYCVSCGVVVPDHQSAKNSIEGQVRRRSDALTNQQPATAGGDLADRAKKSNTEED